jgi:hypothetical protein
MLAITVDDSLAGVAIVNRALPSVVQAVISVAMSLFFAFVLYRTLPDLLCGKGSWLPPLDQLPDEWKTTILAICLVAGFAIVLAPLAISLRTLLYAKVWRFDVLGRTVTRNGERIVALNEFQEILVEGDFRGETDTIDFRLLMKDGRKMTLAQGAASEKQLRRFLEAAKAISNRAKIPYRKETVTGWLSSGQAPAWWTSLT